MFSRFTIPSRPNHSMKEIEKYMNETKKIANNSYFDASFQLRYSVCSLGVYQKAIIHQTVLSKLITLATFHVGTSPGI